MHRLRVLALYKRILRLGQTWEAASGSEADSLVERNYIQTEARRLFRQNRDVADPAEAASHLREGEARLELAQHYGIPYPRLPNLPKNTLAPHHGKATKKTMRTLQSSLPAYMKSYDHTKQKGDN